MTAYSSMTRLQCGTGRARIGILFESDAMTSITRKLLITLLLIAVLTCGGFAVQYRRYAYAILWHCVHKSSIRFGMQRIEVPKLWWVAKTDNYGRISIVRAYSAPLNEPEIEVGPTSPGVMAKSDAEQLRLANAVVSGMNLDPQAGWTHSVVILGAKSSMWYCIRDTMAILGRNVFTSLECNSPQVPYSLHYQGPPEQEKEAKSIFATFQ